MPDPGFRSVLHARHPARPLANTTSHQPHPPRIAMVWPAHPVVGPSSLKPDGSSHLPPRLRGDDDRQTANSTSDSSPMLTPPGSVEDVLPAPIPGSSFSSLAASNSQTRSRNHENMQLASPPTSQEDTDSSPFIPSAQPRQHIFPPPSEPSFPPSGFQYSDDMLSSPPTFSQDLYSSPDMPAHSNRAAQIPMHLCERNSREGDVEVEHESENEHDGQLLDAVVEGIGRVHVIMDMDDAGRWRIKRPDKHVS